MSARAQHTLMAAASGRADSSWLEIASLALSCVLPNRAWASAGLASER